MEWINIGSGLQNRKHATRKHGAKFDRYLRGRYTSDKKTVTVSFGWESTWVAAERARMKVENETGPRMSFVEHCQGQLARLKQNALRGEGPFTFKQERELAKEKAKGEAEAKEEEARQALTLGQFFEEQYIPTANTHKKSKTIEEEKSIYRVWLGPYVGKMKLVDLRPIHVEKVKKTMLDDGKAPRRIQYALAVIRQIWNTARDRGLVVGDWPGRGVKIPKFDNRRMRFLTPKDADRLLTEIKSRSEQTHNISLTSLDCGLRFGEIVKLQWGHVDIENEIIMVVAPKSIRGTKSRAAFMTERVKEMLKGLPQGNKIELIFKDRNGEQITKINHAFFRSVDNLKLNEGVEDRRDKLVFHSLRHSFASNLVSSGSDLYVVSQLLGHTDVSMAARYSHLGAGSLRSAVAAMEQATQEETQEKVVPLKKSGNA